MVPPGKGVGDTAAMDRSGVPLRPQQERQEGKVVVEDHPRRLAVPLPQSAAQSEVLGFAALVYGLPVVLFLLGYLLPGSLPEPWRYAAGFPG